MALERIQKILARAGVASRREAERLVLAGRVTINGTIVHRLGTQADASHDRIEVDTRPIRVKIRDAIVIALHKPRRVLTTLADPEGRPTVRDLLKGFDRRVFPVGRLDWDAEGLVLLTDDGELAHRLMHPSFQVPRTYRVKVRGSVSDALPERLAGEIVLEDGPGKAEQARLLERAERNSWLELTVREGRNHFVKRLLEAHGHPVLRIQRLSYGTVRLGDLNAGRWRRLEEPEIDELRALIAGEGGPPPVAPSGRGATARTKARDEAPPLHSREKLGATSSAAPRATTRSGSGDRSRKAPSRRG